MHFKHGFYGLFSMSSILGDKNVKIIFRHYATLYIVFCVDASESELGILDLIQVRNILNASVFIVCVQEGIQVLLYDTFINIFEIVCGRE